jgi:PAS domain S-box-containing protein
VPSVYAEDRILVLAPTTVDAAMTQKLLREAGLHAEAHSQCGTLVESMRHNAGVLLLTERTILDADSAALYSMLRDQPAWSDIPVVLLAGGGTDSPAAVSLLESLGNVTVLERPTHVVTLVSALRSAVKARQRQYELRDRILALEKAEETLGNSERQFRRLVETAREGIWQVDLTGRTTYVNGRLCEMLGVDAETIFARPVLSFFHPEDRERVGARISCREGMTGDTNEWRLQRSDGSYLWVISSASPVHDANSVIIGAFAMMTDITDRRRTEEALRDSTRRKDEFIAVLAHELRNPLAPIRSSLEILRFGKAEAAPVSLLDMLDRQVNHMVHLVDELLEISRISTGVIALHKSPVALADVVETAVQASEPHIRAAGHELRVSMPDQEVVIEADAVRLAQVLTNLINNAAKYTARGGRIQLTATVSDDDEPDSKVAITVRDNGVGISSDNLTKVFEMFSQVDRDVGRAHQGLGIGLALARNLVLLHGGSIAAKSDGLGTGSEFSVRLPYVPTLQASPPERVPDVTPQGARVLDHYHVLVVDDNADAADSMSALLRAAGASVDVTYDGAHALALWGMHRHAIVLLDIGMPEMNGYELASLIRKENGGDVPVLIALTGWGQRDDRQRTSEAGINYHLVKPVDFETVQRLLATISPEGVAH